MLVPGVLHKALKEMLLQHYFFRLLAEEVEAVIPVKMYLLN